MSAVDLRCIQRLRALPREVKQGENPIHSTPCWWWLPFVRVRAHTREEHNLREREEEEEEAEVLSRFAASD
jgi:hypothetical protein